MDWYQGVVAEYLCADRAIFVHPEGCLQLEKGVRAPKKGEYWYCDIVAADFRSKTFFLCEVSYSVRLGALIQRLKAWHDNWDNLCNVLARDNYMPKDWGIRPWLFVPENSLPYLLKGVPNGSAPKFVPKITTLEMVQPWLYCGGNRIGEIECCSAHRKTKKPANIPYEMR